MAVLTAGEGHGPLARGYPFEGYALVAMPDAFSEVTRDFGEEIGLTREAQSVFEEHLETLATRSLAEFTGTRLLMATARPTLLLHATDDDEVPFACAEGMSAAVLHAQLQACGELGHRAILYAPPVVRAATVFLMELCQKSR
jgi:pimeloyl-ACP methyl ester carboxylesterase